MMKRLKLLPQPLLLSTEWAPAAAKSKIVSGDLRGRLALGADLRNNRVHSQWHLRGCAAPDDAAPHAGPYGRGSVEADGGAKGGAALVR